MIFSKFLISAFLFFQNKIQALLFSQVSSNSVRTTEVPRGVYFTMLQSLLMCVIHACVRVCMCVYMCYRMLVAVLGVCRGLCWSHSVKWFCLEFNKVHDTWWIGQEYKHFKPSQIFITRVIVLWFLQFIIDNFSMKTESYAHIMGDILIFFTSRLFWDQVMFLQEKVMAECFALLPQCGSSGKQRVNYTTAWTETCDQCLGSMHDALDTLYVDFIYGNNLQYPNSVVGQDNRLCFTCCIRGLVSRPSSFFSGEGIICTPQSNAEYRNCL